MGGGQKPQQRSKKKKEEAWRGPNIQKQLGSDEFVGKKFQERAKKNLFWKKLGGGSQKYQKSREKDSPKKRKRENVSLVQKAR